MKSSAEWESIALRAALLLSKMAFDLSLVATISESSNAEVFVDQLSVLGLARHSIIRTDQPETAGALPIDEMFSADSCLLDLSDLKRLRFLVDLPVHTWPGARLLCSLDRIAGGDSVMVREICKRIDAVAGSITSAMQITGSAVPEPALQTLQAWMLTSNLKLALIGLGTGDLCAVTRSGLLTRQAQARSAPNALPALLAAVALSLATRSGPAETIEVAQTFLTNAEDEQEH